MNNVGQGKVVAVHVWPAEKETPLRVDDITLDWGGVIGDRHHGVLMNSDSRQRPVFPRGTEIRNHRQISLVDVAELHQIALGLGIEDIAPGVIADNIATQGFDHLTDLAPMTRLVFSSGAVVMTGGENHPCTIAGRLVGDVYGSDHKRFVSAATDLRGITGWVEHPGTIRPGDTVTAIAP